MSWSVIEKIAEDVGVSPQTVHRILSNGIKDTRPTFINRGARIRKLAEKLNYRPNTAATAIRTGRFSNIGLILGKTKFSSNINQDLFDGIQDGIEEHDMNLLSSRIDELKLGDPEHVPNFFRTLSCDGLIINYHSMMPDSLKSILERSKLPKVWINIERARDTVRPDDFNGSANLTRALLSRKHRKIAYIDFKWFHSLNLNQQHYSKRHRRAGYEKAMGESGLSPRFLSDEGISTTLQAADRIRDMLKGKDRPTAIITYGDSWIQVERICQQLGIKVPGELVTATFASELNAASLHPMPCAVIPEREMGRKAVDMLVAKIEKPGRTFPAIPLPFKLILNCLED
ncbi:MAG TPA: hypothetical protein DCZ94_01365 [Lentisphaeria bacterium]|nr:MAG: hypothetical protein A2X48_11415 [Lentisphaerae bacterium GWF2_49_21]HBC85579.1 hypothetical protein [Lentisphaeria bacterium]